LVSRTRRPRTWVEDRQLAEHIGRSHHGEQIVAAVGRAAADLHLARDDDVQLVARLSLREHGVPAAEVDALQLIAQRGYRAGFDSLDDAGLAEDLVHR